MRRNLSKNDQLIRSPLKAARSILVASYVALLMTAGGCSRSESAPALESLPSSAEASAGTPAGAKKVSGTYSGVTSGYSSSSDAKASSQP
ncbi:hypothetical protein Pan44_39180 [Caulifigura coniformis]|uniref:Uncharacterized protein n=1 Tax=Caulifigura coniformis TaxID=2527983 RepID=A0A517SIB8_9PLAN|nr:hypothetical protein [Caulifigura coniformis]QDT55870.1 hypothetical protein Pan44_39180 [Caulifigura coniformis]